MVVERSNQNLGDSWTGIDPMKMLDDSSLSGIDFSQGTFEQWQNGGGSVPGHCPCDATAKGSSPVSHLSAA